MCLRLSLWFQVSLSNICSLRGDISIKSNVILQCRALRDFEMLWNVSLACVTFPYAVEYVLNDTKMCYILLRYIYLTAVKLLLC